jgi:type II secretory pathway component GspD/PulD (secretin)
VVGGLSTKDFTGSTNTIPILGDIPLLKYLFGTRSRNVNDNTLFVFIKPVILRDDKFADLKYLSGKRLTVAELPGDFPRSEPVPMR